MALSDNAEELEFIVNFSIESIQAAPGTEELGLHCNTIAACYRALGICDLLIGADIDGYEHQLIRSGQTRAYLLDTRRAEGNATDASTRASLVGPFHAALAGHHPDLARRIGKDSPRTFFPDDEYEDDFLYGRFQYDLLDGSTTQEELQAMLDKFEAVLEGGPSARLEVCRALLAKDQATFDEAFDALLLVRRDEIQADKQTFQTETPTFDPESRIFVEGLALLELAEFRGLQTRPEYQPLCPSLARQRGTGFFDSSYFPGQSR